MFNVLNFKSFAVVLFLPFVSFWITEVAYSQTSDQDEFAIFDDGPPSNKKSSAEKGSSLPPSSVIAKDIPKETSEQKIERLKKEIRTGPKNMSLVVQLAEEFFNKKDYDKTTLLLWKHIDKIDRRGLVFLAKAHEKRSEPNEMIRALNIMIGKDSKDAEAYGMMGTAFLLLKKNKDAVENYKKAIELNNKFEPAYNGLITMYEKRNPPNLYELRIIYQDMTEVFGILPRFQRKLCEIDTMDGNSETAIQLCKDAIQKDSSVPDPFVYLGVNYKAIGDDDLAARTLKKAAKNFPKSELAQYHYAKHLEDQKNYIEAMNFYKHATDADTSAARSWLGLATSSFEIKKYELALAAYKNACKHDKKNAVAFRRATTILRNQKNSQWLDKFEAASENCTFN